MKKDNKRGQNLISVGSEGLTPDNLKIALLRALNRELQSPLIGISRALLVFVKRLQRIEEIYSEIRRQFPEVEEGTMALYHKQIRNINRLMERYASRPRLTPVHKVKGRKMGILHHDPWNLEWFPYSNSRMYRRGRWYEIDIALFLIDLARSGRIDVLRQCEECKRWFFARSSPQRFCSEGCHDRFHGAGEGRKQQRRDWAKLNYYQNRAHDLGLPFPRSIDHLPAWQAKHAKQLRSPRRVVLGQNARAARKVSMQVKAR